MAIKLPTFDRLMNPLLRALRALGGSGSVQEIYDKIVELEKMPDDVLSQLHDAERSDQTEVGYRLAWARTYLKKYGLLENSTRGVWALTALAKGNEQVDAQQVVRTVRALDGREAPEAETATSPPSEVPQEDEWKQKLHAVLTQKLAPAAFERLVQRLLRESGFTQVEVTGRSGDGGIDGRGIARIHGFMSFHVLFQCKRYKGVVPSSEIRDFRGAMVGRADKGLFITTGTFSPAAVKEARRDGAPPIDLVDGNDLADKLRDKEMVETAKVDEKWFENV